MWKRFKGLEPKEIRRKQVVFALYMKHLNKTCFIDLCPFILNLVYLFGHLNVLSGGFQGIKISDFIQSIGHWDYQGFPGGSDGKESTCSAGDLGLIPGWGRSPGEKNGYTLQYSCLDNSMNKRTWWITVHGVAKSQTQLYNTFTFIQCTETGIILSTVLGQSEDKD